MIKKFEDISETLDRSKGWIIKDSVNQYVERKDKMLAETRQFLSEIESDKVAVVKNIDCTCEIYLFS